MTGVVLSLTGTAPVRGSCEGKIIRPGTAPVRGRPKAGVHGRRSARVRTSSMTRARNASAGITSCFFPAPRTRSARLSLSASRCPTTAMYGTFQTSPSRIR